MSVSVSMSESTQNLRYRVTDDRPATGRDNKEVIKSKHIVSVKKSQMSGKIHAFCLAGNSTPLPIPPGSINLRHQTQLVTGGDRRIIGNRVSKRGGSLFVIRV